MYAKTGTLQKLTEQQALVFLAMAVFGLEKSKLVNPYISGF